MFIDGNIFIYSLHVKWSNFLKSDSRLLFMVVLSETILDILVACQTLKFEYLLLQQPFDVDIKYSEQRDNYLQSLK